MAEFYHNTISYAQNSPKWAHPTLPYTPQHKHNTITLYQGKASQMNICLNADTIIHHSQQVDEYLSQLILTLP